MIEGVVDWIGSWLGDLVDEYRFALIYAAVAAFWALVRATGVTIKTGTNGLLFSFGRARRVLDPGFRLLIPFLQVVRAVPTRSRTLDLAPQQVTTFEGLVYRVEANLVYRVVDVKKALVEIDQLVKGMLEMLGLGVQEVLRAERRESLRGDASQLDEKLTRKLETRLAPWGVTVESAGFTSITPTRESLRVTQIARVTNERRRLLETLESLGVETRRALGLIGTRKRFISHTRHVRERAVVGQRQRRVLKQLLSLGLRREQIERARLAARPGEASRKAESREPQPARA